MSTEKFNTTVKNDFKNAFQFLIDEFDFKLDFFFESDFSVNLRYEKKDTAINILFDKKEKWFRFTISNSKTGKMLRFWELFNREGIKADIYDFDFMVSYFNYKEKLRLNAEYLKNYGGHYLSGLKKLT